jgi:hypothetical protein
VPAPRCREGRRCVPAAGWRAKGEVFEAALWSGVSSLDPEHRLAPSLAEDLMREINARR